MRIADDDDAPVLGERISNRKDKKLVYLLREKEEKAKIRKARKEKGLRMDTWKKAHLVSADTPTSLSKLKKADTVLLEGMPLNPDKATCPICKRPDLRLTKEHIVPQWAYKRMPLIEGALKRQVFKMLSGENVWYICSDCNNKKGGKMEVSNEVSHKFWKLIHTIIGEALTKYEKTRDRT